MTRAVATAVGIEAAKLEEVLGQSIEKSECGCGNRHLSTEDGFAIPAEPAQQSATELTTLTA